MKGRANPTYFNIALVGLAVASCWAASAAAAQKPSPMIVGGQVVQSGQYTSTVALRNKLDQNSFCTGSVVGDYWILSADHCLNQNGGIKDKNTYYISTGRQIRDGQSFTVDSVYEFPLSQVDVILIKTTTRITSATVSAVPISQTTPTSGNVTMVGWGLTGFIDPQPATRLLKLTLPIAACPGGDRESLFCTNNSARGVASGDSGGPVMTGPPTSPTLVGVIVIGKRPYSMFEKSSAFYNWVQSTISQNSRP